MCFNVSGKAGDFHVSWLTTTSHNKGRRKGSSFMKRAAISRRLLTVPCSSLCVSVKWRRHSKPTCIWEWGNVQKIYMSICFLCRRRNSLAKSQVKQQIFSWACLVVDYALAKWWEPSLTYLHAWIRECSEGLNAIFIFLKRTHFALKVMFPEE